MACGVSLLARHHLSSFPELIRSHPEFVFCPPLSGGEVDFKENCGPELGYGIKTPRLGRCQSQLDLI
jgi:hypothetical protein